MEVDQDELMECSESVEGDPSIADATNAEPTTLDWTTEAVSQSGVKSDYLQIEMNEFSQGKISDRTDNVNCLLSAGGDDASDQRNFTSSLVKDSDTESEYHELTPEREIRDVCSDQIEPPEICEHNDCDNSVLNDSEEQHQDDGDLDDSEEQRQDGAGLDDSEEQRQGAVGLDDREQCQDDDGVDDLEEQRQDDAGLDDLEEQHREDDGVDDLEEKRQGATGLDDQEQCQDDDGVDDLEEQRQGAAGLDDREQCQDDGELVDQDEQCQDIAGLVDRDSDGELEDGELEDESDEEKANMSIPRTAIPKPDTRLLREALPEDVSGSEPGRHTRRASPHLDSCSRPSHRPSSCTDSDAENEEDQAVYVSGASPRKNEYIHDGEHYDEHLLRISSPRRKRRRVDLEPRHKSNAICSYFMQGKCQRGRLCPFSHDATPPKKMELCKFYLMNCCAKKRKCLYMHKSFPCKFFHTGAECFEDSKCKFSHQPLSDITKPILLKHLETAPVEILGDFPRMGRSEALHMFEAAAIRRENNEKPNFTFPNLEICRKRHLVNDVLEGHSSDSERSQRVRRPRARHRSASPTEDGAASDTSSSRIGRKGGDRRSDAAVDEPTEDGCEGFKRDRIERGRGDGGADPRSRGSRDRASSDKSSAPSEDSSRSGQRERGGRHDSELHSRRRRERRERPYRSRDPEDEPGDRAVASGRLDRRRQRNRDRTELDCRERRHRSGRDSHDRWEKSRDRSEHGKYHGGNKFSSEGRVPRRRGLLKTPEPEELLIQKRLLDNARYGANENFSRYSHSLSRAYNMRNIDDLPNVRAFTNGNDNFRDQMEHHSERSFDHTNGSVGGSSLRDGVPQPRDAPFQEADESTGTQRHTSPSGLTMQHSHLYKRIQQQQKDANDSAGKTQTAELTPQPSDEESGNTAYDDWYSSDEECTPIIDKVLKQMSAESDVKKADGSADNETISPAVSKLLSTLKKSTVHFTKCSGSADSGGVAPSAARCGDPRLMDQSFKRSGSRSPRQHVVSRAEDPRSAAACEEPDGCLNIDGRNDAEIALQSDADPRMAIRHELSLNVRSQNTLPLNQSTYSSYASYAKLAEISVQGHGCSDRNNGREIGDCASTASAAPVRCSWPEPSEELNIVAPVLRTDSDQLPFKLIDFHPCVEIDASLNANCSIPWSLIEVDFDVQDYSALQHRVNDCLAPTDPRLRGKTRCKKSSVDGTASSLAKQNQQSLPSSTQIVHKDPRRSSVAASQATPAAPAVPPAYGSGIPVPPPPLNTCLTVLPPVSGPPAQCKGARNMGAGLLPTPPLAMFTGEHLHNLTTPMPLNSFNPLNVLPEPSSDMYRTNVPPPVVLPQQPEARDPRLSSRGPLAPPF